MATEGETPGDDPERASAIVQPFAEAGSTWWLETLWGAAERVWEPATQARIRARVEQGPPAVE